MNRRVAITGIGTVNPLGNEKKSFWASLQKGVCGIGPITTYDTSQSKVTLAAEVKIEVTDYYTSVEARKLDRFTLLASIAAAEALKDSELTTENIDFNRCGVIVSSGIGGITTIAQEQMRGIEKGFDRVSPFFIPMSIANMAAGRIAIESGFHGYASCIVTACAGSANAIGDAMRQIRHGYLDAVLCGGTESAVMPLAIGGFTSMKAVSQSSDPNRASIPFDLERNGFVLGEGAGIIMLEELEHAKERGANIYAVLSGYGTTCDAYHITAPDPTCKYWIKTMRDAITDAGLKTEDIGYINAHGTSTPPNDKCETLAVKGLFGENAKDVPMSSTKSMTGHLLGAAGAVETIICALAVKEGFIPATINHKVFDPECDLDIVPNTGRYQSIKHAMTNSFGFGGHNASLVISRYEQ
ncbi:MAG: beta-ketoacyl-ACP synthase II [Clostridiales bacterium]|nr:beta-ketoacyl-ACP synthase II [Clostridiales bacterium]